MVRSHDPAAPESGAAPAPAPPAAGHLLPPTKFLIPPRRLWIARDRLYALLRTAALPPVILIAAPAGYGKTTLVADWITSDARLAAWLTLDASDNEPILFWTAVATALAAVHAPASARALALLRQSQPAPLATVVTALLNDLTTDATGDSQGRPALLVLDDYHLITQRAIHELVRMFLDHLPPPVRLVLTSRGDPPLLLGRLRVRAQLLEIRTDDLAFDGAEVAAFLAQTMGLTLSAVDTHLLHRRTEGWAAALQLAALSLRQQADPSAFLARFGGSHHHLLTYLVEEVFNQQPPDVQAFLLATAVLDQLCASLCAAVLTGAPTPAETARAAERLGALEAAHLFLVALDSRSAWYRYHPLFAEMLRHRLALYDPALAPVAHRRASAWYAQAGDQPAAIRHILAVPDWETAAGLIEAGADDLRQRGEFGLLDTWLAALPPEVRQARPELGFWQATRLIQRGAFGAAERALADLEQIRPGPGGSAALSVPFVARKAVLHALLARLRHDAPAQIGRAAEAALAQLPPDDQEWRALALLLLGMAAYEHDDLDQAAAQLQAASALSDAANYYLVLLLSRSQIGQLLCDRGELRAAQAYCAATRALVGARGIDDLAVVAHLEVLEAQLRYETNDLAGAEQAARRAITLGDQGQLSEPPVHARLLLGRIRLAQHDPDGALAAMETAVRLVSPSSTAPAASAGWRAALDAWQTTIQLAQSGLDPAPRATPLTPAEGPADHLTYWIWRATHVLPVQVRLRGGDAAGAYTDLVQRGAQAEAVGAWSLRLTLGALEAGALGALGRAGAAREVLLRTVQRGAAEGYVRAILDAGPILPPVLRELEQDLAHAPERHPGLLAYVRRLAEALPAADPSGPGLPAAGRVLRPGPGGDALTDRELAILRLVATGYSNQAIADQLILAPSTVKWYLHSIHQKLDVASRAQAVARARALGLIP